MKKSKKAQELTMTDTRDAVEAAIEIAKGDRESKWENPHSFHRITRWSQPDKNFQPRPASAKSR